MKVAITSGGTRIKFDDVRFIEWDYESDGSVPVFTNFSKGGFGAKIVDAILCLCRDVEVYHIPSTEATLPLTSKDSRYHRFSYYDYNDYREVTKEVIEKIQPDIVLLAAAVSDYGAPKVDGKVSSDKDEISFTLSKLPKVIKDIKHWNPNCIQVGFKLLSNVDHETLLKTAFAAGAAANSDFTIANDMNSVIDKKHTVYMINHHTGESNIYDVSDMGGVFSFVLNLLRECRKMKGENISKTICD